MTRLKTKPKTKKTVEPETVTATEPDFVDSSNNQIQETETLVSVPLNIEETPILTETELPPVDTLPEQEQIVEVSQEECEMFYGVVLETAHSIIGTRKEGTSHRELPDSRRKAQGKLLYNICKKYNIQIPTEFEIIIFGGSLVADWQYMGTKDIEKGDDVESKDKTS